MTTKDHSSQFTRNNVEPVSSSYAAVHPATSCIMLNGWTRSILSGVFDAADPVSDASARLYIGVWHAHTDYGTRSRWTAGRQRRACGVDERRRSLRYNVTGCMAGCRWHRRAAAVSTLVDHRPLSLWTRADWLTGRAVRRPRGALTTDRPSQQASRAAAGSHAAVTVSVFCCSKPRRRDRHVDVVAIRSRHGRRFQSALHEATYVSTSNPLSHCCTHCNFRW